MILVLWILVVTAAATGAAVAALTALPGRRAAGLVTVALAVAVLLILLGLDLPAVLWLGVGVAAALLALPGGGEADLGPPVTAPAPTPGARLVAGTGAGLLFAMLYRVVQQTGWSFADAAPAASQAAVTGGRLLTEDLAPTILAAVLLAVILLVLGGGRADVDAGGGAP